MPLRSIERFFDAETDVVANVHPKFLSCLGLLVGEYYSQLATANPEWAVGFEDECWWSRVALRTLSAWGTHGEPLRLLQSSVAKGDPEPKAISCYGLYLPEMDKTCVLLPIRTENRLHFSARLDDRTPEVRFERVGK